MSPTCSIEDIAPQDEIGLNTIKQSAANYQTLFTVKTKEDEDIYYQVTTQNCHDEFINPLSENEDSRSQKEEYQTKKLITPLLMKGNTFSSSGAHTERVRNHT